MDNTKERPIIFNAQEVNAVLAGDKTQHRVPINIKSWGAPEFMGSRDCDKKIALNWGWDNFDNEDTVLLPDLGCPMGRIGDRLWVQEVIGSGCRSTEHGAVDGVEYKADEAHQDKDDWDWLPLRELDSIADADTDEFAEIEGMGWLEPENMPRWASRILLEITDIRIERLNDISEQDAIAEGIKYIHADPKNRVGPNHFTKSNGWYHCSRPTAAEVFKEMYTVSDDYEEHGENPWVWVIEFKSIKESDNG